ncbi:hypothetical protein SLEP1_g44065 [Rubroshorea leprosula]|uniref:Uncharacterized protein n=1 Tax=Rubroshorea leprosula TaxID=152421 RepID=A0AAV5LF14_9ROSI|nr:hypothetical protein SLEP1_g44065 [Rubroshorea leprosula]
MGRGNYRDQVILNKDKKCAPISHQGSHTLVVGPVKRELTSAPCPTAEVRALVLLLCLSDDPSACIDYRGLIPILVPVLFTYKYELRSLVQVVVGPVMLKKQR